MKRVHFVLAGFVLVAVAAAVGGYWYGTSHVTPPVAQPDQNSADRKILYWYDPMVPQQRFDKPGKSPFMDMDLVPKYAEEESGAGGVTIDPRVAQNLGVRTAEAARGRLERRVEAVGSVVWNERGVFVVQARSGGFVEKLHARAPLDRVEKGQPLVDLLAPDWAAAQEEYLLLHRSGKEAGLAEAARNRLQLLGMSEEQISLLEKTGRPQTRITLYAPIGGVIAELGVREGMTVAAGAMLFRLVDLSTVWVNADVPEAQGAWLRPGTAVEARVPSFPGQLFRGRVSAILPEVNTVTRTLRARVELANPGGRLKPGMYATLGFAEDAGVQALIVPSEAVIRTGERSVVIVAEGEGRFRQQDVELGFESGGRVEIRKGLSEGDKVVVSGQFLIDSEASLRATGTRMKGGAQGAGAQVHRGVGEIVSFGAGQLLIRHGGVPSAEMGAMTMPFSAPPGVVPSGLKKGDRVQFDFSAQPDGQLQITRIGPADASLPDHGAHK
ncbi:MAG TPA: efflux RND transporter periplasmic adaptor subunit [Burkholderiales bacterium]|nr:efflux RND transporter periplasmic adaptor subunit [Burkholderiales bacterium]